jgi:signal transduction histidine kinase/preprotein translocase subunit Sss1
MLEKGLFKKLPEYFGFAVGLLGVVVLMGWFTHNQSLIQIFPNLVPMQFNTALCFLLIGAATFMLSRRLERKLPIVIAVIGGTIGLLTLLEYVLGISLGLDELFMEHYITTETSHPGRMAPNTALCFFLSAYSLVLISSNKNNRIEYAGVLGSLTLGLGLVALTGYFIGVEATYGWGRYTRMAVHTSIGFIMLGLALAFFSWHKIEESKSNVDKLFPAWLPGSCISFAITVLLIDIRFPLGLSTGSMYIILVLFGWFITKPKFTLWLAVLGTGLALVGYYLSPDGGLGFWAGFTNRLFTIFIIWLVGLLLYSIKRHEIALEKAKADLDKKVIEVTEKNEVMEQFTYIASHDLQEPLRTMKSFAEILSQDYTERLDELGKKCVGFVMEASDRMSQLVKGLLDYSRLGMKRETALINFNKAVQDVVLDLNLLITERQAILEVETLPSCNGYEMEIRSLFQNLISNAIKFSKKNEPPRIQISASKKDGFYEFSVKDNGIGIRQGHTEQIFSIFKRLHSRADYEGTGIGLAHCARIVMQHNGKIWVESEEGKGSTFFFTISTKLD